MLDENTMPSQWTVFWKRLSGGNEYPNSAGDKQLEEVFFKLADIVGWSWTTDSLDAGHCIVCNGWLILSSFLEGKKTDMFFGKHLNTLRLLTGCMRLSHASSSLTHLTHS